MREILHIQDQETKYSLSLSLSLFPSLSLSLSLSHMESNPPPLPAMMKRLWRKVREVSSRYMEIPSPSPIPPLLPTSSLVHSHPKHRQSPSVPSSPDATKSEPNPHFANENYPVRRSLETPIFSGSNALSNKLLVTISQWKEAVRLFSDNGGADDPRKPSPVITSTTKAASLSNTQLRAGRNSSTARGARPTPFRSDDDTCSENSEAETCSDSSHGRFCDSQPIVGLRARQQVSEFRSLMLEADLLSSRRVLDGNDNSCCWALNMALSSSQQNPFHGNKAAGRCIPSRICLPLYLPKLDGEVKKGKNRSSRQEDVHMLRILDVFFVQKLLYGLPAKISKMKDSVAEKRVELDRLRRLRYYLFIY